VIERGAEDAPRVGGGFARQVFERHPAGAREGVRDGVHERRLVALAPVWHRGEVGGVGLDEQAISRAGGQSIVHRPVLEGDHAAEGKVRTDGEARFEHADPRAERVQHDSARDPAEHRGHIGVGVARVDDGRLPALGCKAELGLEGAALERPGRVIVVVIETDLAERDDFGVSEERLQPLGHLRRPVLRDVGVDPGGR
jgi:hypothetical protein